MIKFTHVVFNKSKSSLLEKGAFEVFLTSPCRLMFLVMQIIPFVEIKLPDCCYTIRFFKKDHSAQNSFSISTTFSCVELIRYPEDIKTFINIFHSIWNLSTVKDYFLSSTTLQHSS